MARCHGSDSSVILSGRDNANESYYRGNIRNHTTAAAAFIYTFSTPKLRMHGSDGSSSVAADTNSRQDLGVCPRRRIVPNKTISQPFKFCLKLSSWPDNSKQNVQQAITKRAGRLDNFKQTSNSRLIVSNKAISRPLKFCLELSSRSKQNVQQAIAFFFRTSWPARQFQTNLK